MNRGQDERGAALIVVLGLVAVIAGWAAAAAYEDMLSLRRASNAQSTMQAEMACISALRLAELTLREDGKNSQTDDLDEVWAQPPTPFPLDDGLVMGEIVDSNRYLNLNDLVNDQGVVDSYTYPVFERLFKALELDQSLLPTLADWLDADDRALNGGMESVSYDYATSRIKNARLDRWDELRMIPGFTASVRDALSQVACVRPTISGIETPINLNTTDKRILLALFPALSEAEADTLIADRPYQDTTSLEGSRWLTRTGQAQLAVASDMFFIRIQASFARVNRHETYLLSRQSGNVQMVWREWNLWQP